MKKLNQQYLIALVTLILIVFMVNPIKAQSDSDFQAWSAIELTYKPNKKLSFGLEGQWRFKDNASITDQYFAQLTSDYEIFNNFKLGAAMRYIRDNDTKGNIQGFENHIRFHLDANYSHKIERFKLKYRMRFQNKNELGISKAEGDYNKQYLRLKTSVEYNIRNWKLDPKVSGEIFRHYEEGETTKFDKYRLTLETEYKLKGIGKINLYYRVEKEINTDLPDTINILELKFTYNL